MIRRRPRPVLTSQVMRYLWVFVVVSLSLAQQTAQKKQAPPPKEEDPMIKTPLSFKGSKASKESATYASNGIDPATGKFNTGALPANPASDAVEKAKKMSEQRPKPEQVAAFVREGGLRGS